MKIAELSIMEDTTYLPVGLVASKLRKTVGQANLSSLIYLVWVLFSILPIQAMLL